MPAPTCYDILPGPQKAILPDLKPVISLGFTLYGGTAIALHFGHRQSIDFDYFSARPINRKQLIEQVPFLKKATVLQDEPDTWTVQTYPLGHNERPVKLSFFGGLRFGRVGTPTFTDKKEIRLASLDDLFGHKLKVLLQRVELKDYQDIAVLLRAGFRLERGLGAALSLFPNMFPPAEALRALTYFQGGDVKNLSESDRSILISAINSVGPIEPMPICSHDLT